MMLTTRRSTITCAPLRNALRKRARACRRICGRFCKYVVIMHFLFAVITTAALVVAKHPWCDAKRGANFVPEQLVLDAVEKAQTHTIISWTMITIVVWCAHVIKCCLLALICCSQCLWTCTCRHTEKNSKDASKDASIDKPPLAIVACKDRRPQGIRTRHTDRYPTTHSLSKTS